MIFDPHATVPELVARGLPVGTALEVRAFARFLGLLGPPSDAGGPRVLRREAIPAGVDVAELVDAVRAYAFPDVLVERVTSGAAARRLLELLGDELGEA